MAHSLDNYIKGGKQEIWLNSYGRANCRSKCDAYFPHKQDNWLEKACNNECDTTCNKHHKCPPKGNTPYPTKAFILQQAGVQSTTSGWSEPGTTETTPDGDVVPTTNVPVGDPSLTYLPVDIEPKTAGLGAGMSNKTTLIIIGLLAVGGIGYFMFKK